METISLKMEESLLQEIDRKLKANRYSTRTEFIRDAIRSKLSEQEKKEFIKIVTALKGSLKGKGLQIDEENAGEIAFMKIAKKLNVLLD